MKDSQWGLMIRGAIGAVFVMVGAWLIFGGDADDDRTPPPPAVPVTFDPGPRPPRKPASWMDEEVRRHRFAEEPAT